MTNLLTRKHRLCVETAATVQGRAICAQVNAWGIEVRLKGTRHTLPLSWQQIYNRAAIVAADQAREAKIQNRRTAQ